jgi:hypothetical protein
MTSEKQNSVKLSFTKNNLAITGGPRPLSMRTRRAARAAQFRR